MILRFSWGVVSLGWVPGKGRRAAFGHHFERFRGIGSFRAFWLGPVLANILTMEGR